MIISSLGSWQPPLDIRKLVSPLSTWSVRQDAVDNTVSSGVM